MTNDAIMLAIWLYANNLIWAVYISPVLAIGVVLLVAGVNRDRQ